MCMTTLRMHARALYALALADLYPSLEDTWMEDNILNVTGVGQGRIEVGCLCCA